MSRPLSAINPEAKTQGVTNASRSLAKRPLAGIWMNPAAFPDKTDPFYGLGAANGETFLDLLTIAGNGWTEGTPGFRFRKHADGSLEFKGYLEPGSSGTVAFTLPGAGTIDPDEADYRPENDSSFLTDIQTGPTSFTIGRVQIDATTGDVTITYPAN